MVASFVVLATLIQAPKTLEDLDLLKIKAYQALKTYRDVLTIEIETSKLTKTTLKDGVRFHSNLSLPDGSKMESYNNGSMSWVILHAQKTYVESKVAQSLEFDPKSHLLKAEEGSLQFKFEDNRPVQFATTPSLPITLSDTVKEGNKELRRFVTSGTGKSGKKLTITQYFLPDRWIVVRFMVEGEGESGPTLAKGEVTEQDFKAKVSDSLFKPDLKKLEGYSKAG